MNKKAPRHNPVPDKPQTPEVDLSNQTEQSIIISETKKDINEAREQVKNELNIVKTKDILSHTSLSDMTDLSDKFDTLWSDYLTKILPDSVSQKVKNNMATWLSFALLDWMSKQPAWWNTTMIEWLLAKLWWSLFGAEKTISKPENDQSLTGTLSTLLPFLYSHPWLKHILEQLEIVVDVINDIDKDTKEQQQQDASFVWIDFEKSVLIDPRELLKLMRYKSGKNKQSAKKYIIQQITTQETKTLPAITDSQQRSVLTTIAEKFKQSWHTKEELEWLLAKWQTLTQIEWFKQQWADLYSGMQENIFGENSTLHAVGSMFGVKSLKDILAFVGLTGTANFLLKLVGISWWIDQLHQEHYLGELEGTLLSQHNKQFFEWGMAYRHRHHKNTQYDVPYDDDNALLPALWLDASLATTLDVASWESEEDDEKSDESDNKNKKPWKIQQKLNIHYSLVADMFDHAFATHSTGLSFDPQVVQHVVDTSSADLWFMLTNSWEPDLRALIGKNNKDNFDRFRDAYCAVVLPDLLINAELMSSMGDKELPTVLLWYLFGGENSLIAFADNMPLVDSKRLGVLAKTAAVGVWLTALQWWIESPWTSGSENDESSVDDRAGGSQRVSYETDYNQSHIDDLHTNYSSHKEKKYLNDQEYMNYLNSLEVAYWLPKFLLRSVMKRESQWELYKNGSIIWSNKWAKWLFQFMPDTATEWAGKLWWWVTQKDIQESPKYAALAAARMLKNIGEVEGGWFDMYKALISYNFWPRNYNEIFGVQKPYDKSKFDELKRKSNGETSQYITDIPQYMKEFTNKARLPDEIEVTPAIATDKLAATKLKEMALISDSNGASLKSSFRGSFQKDGATLSDMKQAVDAKMQTSDVAKKYTSGLIFGGINDLWTLTWSQLSDQTKQSLRETLSAMITAMKDKGVEPVLSTLFVSEEKQGTDRAARARRFNTLVRKLAKKEWVKLIDFERKLADKFDDDSYIKDDDYHGAHLTGQWYTAMKKIVQERLSESNSVS